MASTAIFLLILSLASCKLTVKSVLYFDSDDDIKLLIKFSAQSGALYELNLNADLPPNLNNEETSAHLLKSMAFIPLKDQKCHSEYVNGFPAVDQLKKPPISKISDCKTADPAIPDIDFKTTRSNIYFVLVDTDLNITAGDLDEINSKCTDVTESSRHCGYRPPSSKVLLFMCELNVAGSATGPSDSPTGAAEMMGFLAQVHTLKPADVYMRFFGRKRFDNSGLAFDIPIKYELEKDYPRILWPSWLNTHLHLKNSYHICLKHISCIKNDMDSTFCANLVKDLQQLSLTYTYFVCRFLHGAGADGLCPDICGNDPCMGIANAVRGTCVPLGFRIHRLDFFCYCEAGYKWEYRSTPESSITGQCVKSDFNASSHMIEPCTRLEMEIFCSLEGTEKCTVDRMVSDRRANCSCKPEYEGLDCATKETDVCINRMGRGRLMCRSHEGQGVCKPGSIKGSYSCECMEHYMRWLDADGYESCRQWNPSKWLDRAISCGYDAKLTMGCALRDYCSIKVCSDTRIKEFLELQEESQACNNNGKCVPAIQSGNPSTFQESHCECNTGFSGALCDVKITYYTSWTQWTVCYDRNIIAALDTGLLTGVSPTVSRVSLRFKDCELPLKRFDNGSAPRCQMGRTEVKHCPSLVTDRPDTLKASDYGVASQAVISMWRVVEIILLLDGALVAVIGVLLFYQNLVLAKVDFRQPMQN